MSEENTKPAFFRPITMDHMTSYWAGDKSILVAFESKEDCRRFESHIERIIANAKKDT